MRPKMFNSWILTENIGPADVKLKEMLQMKLKHEENEKRANKFLGGINSIRNAKCLPITMINHWLRGDHLLPITPQIPCIRCRNH